ncbi:MAG: hypothetical protein AMJ64_13715 [Betaproteobacteria bacterium SG8_39]|nr:MAG: hypothetical protein AMJ64_13715 [Betaproteobacteria bacterium SG8_39]
MSRVGRRRAITTLFALGASGPFSVRAQPPGLLAKLFGRGGALGDDAFEWLPTECADERYPMQLVSGQLHCGEDRIIEVPAGKIVNNGWGGIGSTRLIGDPIKPVPERLTVAWFSYAEDQFFGGSVELPRAELTALFRAGYEDPLTGERATWHRIIVGMGLGGWTSVWLAGSGLVREVARAQLETKVLDWRWVLDNPAIPRAKYVRSKLQSRLGEVAAARLAKHGPPVSTWPRYAQRYRWRMVVEGLHPPLDMSLRSFNGERSYYDFAKQPPGALEIAPKHLQITWRSRSGGRLLTEIQLDEEEVFGAFDKAAAGTAATTLRVGFATRKEVALSVESGAARLPLTRSRIRLSSL